MKAERWKEERVDCAQFTGKIITHTENRTEGTAVATLETTTRLTGKFLEHHKTAATHIYTRVCMTREGSGRA